MSVSILRTFPDTPFYTMVTSLDGRDYLFEFRYNGRENAWYFDIGLPDGTVLVRGVKVVCNVSLLGRFADSRLPPGVLMAMPTGGVDPLSLAGAPDKNGRPTIHPGTAKLPGLGELGEGKRVELFYTSASEFAT